MAFSTQKDFFHVPFMNESVEYECKKTCVKLKSYDSTVDDRAWALDDAKQSKFLSDIVTCETPVGDGEGASSRFRGKQPNEAMYQMGPVGGDSLLECANTHLGEYQKILNINTHLEKQLEVSKERLKTANDENRKIKEILAAKLDHNVAKDFLNKIQQMRLDKSEENDLMQMYRKIADFVKAYEVLQAENNYVKRLVEKLSTRVSINNIPTEPERSTDVSYLQGQVNNLRRECIMLRKMEDDYLRFKQYNQQERGAQNRLTNEDAENIRAIVDERNKLREKCKSFKTLEKKVGDLQQKEQYLNDNLHSKAKYINSMETKMERMHNHYEDQKEKFCFTEECLKAQLEEMKQDLLQAKCQAQRAEVLQREVCCLQNEILKRDMVLADYDCQYKQLMRVVCELQECCARQKSVDTDDLVFFAQATLNHIGKELQNRDRPSSSRQYTDTRYKEERRRPGSISGITEGVTREGPFDDCCSELEQLRRKLEEFERGRLKDANCDDICAEALDRIRRLEELNDQLKKDLENARAENERLQQSLRDCNNKMNNMLNNLNDMEDELKTNAKEAKEIGRDLDSTRELVKDISDMQLKNQQLANAVNAINQREGENTINDLRKQLEDALNQLKKCQQNNEKLQKDLDEKEKQLRDINDLNNKLKAEKEKLAADMEKLKEERDRLAAGKSKLEAEMDKLAQDMDKLRKERDNLLDDKKKWDDEKNKLLDNIKKLENDKDKLASDLKKMQDERDKLAADKKKLEDEKDKLMSDLKKLQGEKEKLESDLKKMQDERDKLAAEKKKLEDEKNKLAADLKKLEADKAKLEADLKRVQDERDKLAAEKKKLEDEKNKLAADLRKLEAEKEKLEFDLKKMQDERDKLAAEKKKLEDEKNKLAADLKKLEADKAKLEADLKKMQDERDKLAAEKKKLEDEKNKLAADLKKLEADKAKLEADLKKMQDERDKLAAEKKKLEDEKNKLAADLKKLEADKARLEADLKRVQDERDKLAADKKKLEDEKNKLAADLKKIEDERNKLASDLKKLEDENAKLTADKKKLDAEKDKLTSDLKKMDDEKSKLHTNVAKLENEKGKLTSELRKSIDERDKRVPGKMKAEEDKGKRDERREDRGGERQGERGGERQGERGGERQAERGGERQAERGGERQAERGGERQAERGGERQAERGGERQAERGGERQGQRGGPKKGEPGEEWSEEPGGEKGGEPGKPKKEGRREFSGVLPVAYERKRKEPISDIQPSSKPKVEGIRDTSKKIAKPKEEEEAIETFVRKSAEKFNIKGMCFEKELRKILDEFIEECSFCFCRLANPKSKVYAICHKTYHYGLHTLSFRELAYLHRKVFKQCEQLLPGFLLNMILNDNEQQAKDMLLTISCTPSKEQDERNELNTNNTLEVQSQMKCCQCKSDLCCYISEENLKHKVDKLEKDIKDAKEYLKNLKSNTDSVESMPSDSSMDIHSTYRVGQKESNKVTQLQICRKKPSKH